MITFLISLIALSAEYFFYSRIVEKIVGIDPARKTPAVQLEDGVDFVVGFSITIGISVALALLLAALLKVYRKKEIALNVND